jgi:SMC interacting uncharacterized protein involved in chromosome segregation
MSRPREITQKLKGADPELSRYIVELEKKNIRLHKKVAKLQVEVLSKNNEIKALNKASSGVNIILQGSPDQGQNIAPSPPALPEAQPYQHPQPLIPGKPIQITK